MAFGQTVCFAIKFLGWRYAAVPLRFTPGYGEGDLRPPNRTRCPDDTGGRVIGHLGEQVQRTGQAYECPLQCKRSQALDGSSTHQA